MSNKSQLQTNNAKLTSLIAELQGKAAGGGSGGGVETCTVTVIQTWGMNDDPDLLHLYVPYYNVLADGSIETSEVHLTSYDDLEPQHSITFTAYKNVPINVIAYTSSASISKFTTNADGGNIVSRTSIATIETMGLFGSLIPTGDTATFTFSSP